MNIPKVDYSPIYNALNVQKQASDAEYNLKLFDLQKQGQTADALIGLASLGLDIAKTVISIREQREMESAKSDAFTVSDELSKKATDLIYNDQYSVNTESAQYDYGMASQELTGGDQNLVKTQSITLDSDYDEYFNDRLAVVDQKYKSNTVKEWLKDQLRVAYQEGKNRALSYAYKKEEEDYVNLFTSNLNSAIKQSIATGNKGLYEAQVSSSKFSAKQKKALLMDAETQFTKGMTQKTISQVVNEKGPEEAITYIQGLNKDAQETAELISYAIDQAKISEAIHAKTISDMVMKAQENKVKPGQIAESLKKLSSIPEYYKKEAISSLLVQQSITDIRSAITSGGYAKALELADSLGNTEEERIALRQAADQTDRAMLNQVDSEIQTMYKKLSESGIPQATILNTIEKVAYPEEYLKPAIDKVKASMSIEANNATMEEYNRAGVRGNYSSIKSLYNKILSDKMGRYAGLESQKTSDLDYLERELKTLEVTAPSPTELQKETDKKVELIYKGFTENAMIPGTGEHFSAENAISMIRELIPQASKNYATDMITEILKYEAPQHKTIFQNMNDTIKNSMIQGYGKKKYEDLPDEYKKEISSAQAYVYNWAHDAIGHEPTMSAEKLQAGINQQLAVYFSKEYDILRKGKVEQTLRTGPEGTLPDIVSGMAKGEYDELVYSDTVSGQIVFNPKVKDTLEASYQILESKVQEITGSKPLRSYQIQSSGDVGAMPIFTDTKTGEQYIFGVDYTGKNLVTYTRKNAQDTWVEWQKPYTPPLNTKKVPEEEFAGVKLPGGKTIPSYGTVKGQDKTTVPATQKEVVKVGNEMYEITTQLVNGKPVEISRKKLTQTDADTTILDFSMIPGAK